MAGKTPPSSTRLADLDEAYPTAWSRHARFRPTRVRMLGVSRRRGESNRLVTDSICCSTLVEPTEFVGKIGENRKNPDRPGTSAFPFRTGHRRQAAGSDPSAAGDQPRAKREAKLRFYRRGSPGRRRGGGKGSTTSRAARPSRRRRADGVRSRRMKFFFWPGAISCRSSSAPATCGDAPWRSPTERLPRFDRRIFIFFSRSPRQRPTAFPPRVHRSKPVRNPQDHRRSWVPIGPTPSAGFFKLSGVGLQGRGGTARIICSSSCPRRVIHGEHAYRRRGFFRARPFPPCARGNAPFPRVIYSYICRM